MRHAFKNVLKQFAITLKENVDMAPLTFLRWVPRFLGHLWPGATSWLVRSSLNEVEVSSSSWIPQAPRMCELQLCWAARIYRELSNICWFPFCVKSASDFAQLGSEMLTVRKACPKQHFCARLGLTLDLNINALWVWCREANMRVYPLK